MFLDFSKRKTQNFLDCISQVSSREIEPIGCAYVWKKIYYKELPYAVMKAGKSAEWAGKLDFTFPLGCNSSLLEDSILLRDTGIFVLLSLSTDWMRPTYIIEGHLLLTLN